MSVSGTKTPRVKIQIHPTLPPVILLAFALGRGREFLLVLLAVTIHELSHVLVGRFFKLSVKRFVLTPLGEIAEIEKMESLTEIPRLAVVLAGPLVNFLLFGICQGYFATANLALCLFNLLPAYPMDGGRFWHIILGRRLGVLRAGRIVTRWTRFFAGLLIAAGLVQAVLFSYNISLFCAGVYLIQNNRREKLRLQWDFYRYFTARRLESIPLKKRTFKCFLFDGETSLLAMLQELRWDLYSVFLIAHQEKIIAAITEGAVIKAAYQPGAGRRAIDLLKND
ncbi:MAG: hypothetical protein LBT44_05985 [Clostridiales bacterium]|jgi:stage IV sporulation protein FB|nr:hypothetical protein [Clostridiales bacterium]